MRMDNETYRLKVESLFDLLRGENGVWKPDVQAELEQLAVSPRKGRYFLRVVSAQPRDIQVYFYQFFMRRCQRDDAIADLERHIRHMFYENREEAKSVLAAVAVTDTLQALFRVIALTEEGWLAGELIRVVLAVPGEVLAEPIRKNLHSQDYLLQCLAIYLIGKSGDETLLQLLAEFYRKPEGEKLERLEKKAYDAMLEGARSASARVVLRWLKDKSYRVREVALVLVAERQIPEAVADLVGLVLVDPKTRPKAAAILLAYAQAKLLSWNPQDAGSADVRKIMAAAKPAPLLATIRTLLRDENPVVRETAVNLARLAPASEELAAQLRRLVAEDKAAAVQVAALYALAELDQAKLVLSMIELYSADAPSKEAVEAANALISTLSDADTRTVKQGVSARLEKREAALDRFVANVEWWRHDT